MFRHIGIVVNDIEKMLWFYRDILSLDVMYDEIEGGSFLNHILNTKGESPRIIKLGSNEKTIVELLDFNKNDSSAKKNLLNKGYTHFAITIDNCDKMYSVLKNNNLKTINHPIESQNKVKVFFGLDPEDNIIEFVEVV
jgi:catechol 2,3-dioxygenase-like lactoylglutathione lyase family enzyme